MNTIFDKMNSTVVESLNNHPEAFADTQYLKMNAASVEKGGGQVVIDPCNRTPVEEPLSQPIIDALNLALLAEYLETEFYSRGLNTPGLIRSDLQMVFTRILLNEVGHRETLLTVLGSRAIPKPEFDFTAQGVLPDVFTNFDTFIGLGQTFEDNGVRAIKGQAPNVQSDDFILTTALRFHSVEARHASELRRIRGQKGWITLNSRGDLPPIAQGVYDGEENVVQGGINLVTLTGLPATTVSESFDEPLTAFQVMANVQPFIRRRRRRNGGGGV